MLPVIAEMIMVVELFACLGCRALVRDDVVVMSRRNR